MEQNIEATVIEQTAIRKQAFRQRILGMFLFIVIITFLAKIIEAILLDLGFGIDGQYNPGWWHDVSFDGDERIQDMLIKRPHIFWIFTQFTWLTTAIILIYLILRFFQYDENVPPWLRWILSPRSLTLLAAYDTSVAIIFWMGLASNYQADFTSNMFVFQLLLTIVVHAIIPFFIFIYALLVQVYDEKASMLREKYIIVGMVYPLIYAGYYIIVSLTWNDPYPITDLHNNFASNIIWIPIALIGVYIIIGFFMIVQNALLLKFNKHYDPLRDYGVIEYKRTIMLKAKRKARRKFAKTYTHYLSVEKQKISNLLKEEESKKPRSQKKNRMINVKNIIIHKKKNKDKKRK